MDHLNWKSGAEVLPLPEARELYPSRFDWHGYMTSLDLYQPILQAFGQVMVSEATDDTKGSKLVLIKREDRHGFLSFQFSSEAEEDPLMSCQDIGDVQELIASMRRRSVWFDTPAAALDVFRAANNATRWYTGKEIWRRFRDRCVKHLHRVEAGRKQSGGSSPSPGPPSRAWRRCSSGRRPSPQNPGPSGPSSRSTSTWRHCGRRR